MRHLIDRDTAITLASSICLVSWTTVTQYCIYGVTDANIAKYPQRV